MKDTINAAVRNPQRLAALWHLNLLDGPAEHSFNRLAQLAARLLHAPVALVSLVDTDRQFFKSCVGLNEPVATERQTPLSHSFCKYVVASHKPLIIADARRDAQLKDNPAITELGVIAYAGIPLITGDGFVLGSFCVIDHQPRRWSSQEIAVLQDLAASVMTEIELRGELIERQRLEAQLREAITQAERAHRAKDEFLSRMSHELRTPLNAILGFAQVLAFEARSDEDRQSVEHILTAGQHLLNLINEVLDLNQVESGNLILATEPVEVSAMLQETLDMVRPFAASTRIELPEQLASSCRVAVIANLQRLRQVVLNLLTNAVKYNREGGSVEIACQEHAFGRIRILVCDQGAGLSAEQISRLYTPYDRLGAEHTMVRGTGLGLALSQRLVHAMGGSIGVESTIGSGSVFWIDLPSAGAHTN